jgi:tetratricopeptide (TPR) repeat protein
VLATTANKEYDKAIADYADAIRIDPKHDYPHYARALIWATCSDAKYRDGRRAIESAKQALDLTTNAAKRASYMEILAAAFAEAGDFAEAVRWQETVLRDPQCEDEARARARLQYYRNDRPLRQD